MHLLLFPRLVPSVHRKTSTHSGRGLLSRSHTLTLEREGVATRNYIGAAMRHGLVSCWHETKAWPATAASLVHHAWP